MKKFQKVTMFEFTESLLIEKIAISILVDDLQKDNSCLLPC